MTSANGQQKALGVALEDPGRRVSDVLARQDADNHRDFRERLEGLNAVEQHGLAGNPPELLQLFRSRARPAPGGDDNDTNVALHSGAEELSK
jgi:hypothetical protein